MVITKGIIINEKAIGMDSITYSISLLTGVLYPIIIILQKTIKGLTYNLIM